jgi:GxxExxY protein
METTPLSTSQLNKLSAIILDAAITVHKEIGPGLLESVYQHCMIKELQTRNIQVNSLVRVPLSYKGEPLKKDYIIDMLVEDEIILELKAIDEILSVHEAQIISYLKLANKRLGFLINFNAPVLHFSTFAAPQNLNVLCASLRLSAFAVNDQVDSHLSL